MFEVKEYHWTMRCHVENFRQKAMLEGNDALPLSKYNPDDIEGQTFYIMENNEIVALVALEVDHYATKNPKVLRACRFHTLKQYRNLALGTSYLFPAYIRWAKKMEYDCVYWTQDIKNKGLNAIYQRKRKPTKHEHLNNDKFWNSVQLDHRWLFQVDKKSDLLQYVYYVDLKESGYKLNPIDCVVWQEHDGQI